ncbi:iripin-1-like [Dermacentor variabilis]|uniref:iripin-1-like n=1 Tax=Dermacentor variabilis TaxID=34621 RepID=UPI003F5B61B8
MERRQPIMKTAICIAWLMAVCVAQDETKISSSINSFGFELLREIPVSSQTNIFYSPYSVYTALAMAYVGARGDTMQDLHEALGYSSVGLSPDLVPSLHAKHTRRLREQASNSTLYAANAAVIQEGYNVEQQYLDSLRQYFDAQVSTANLADEHTLTTINDWVKNKTAGKIEELLNAPLSSDARLVILNAIYFKGLWNTPFHAEATSKAPFFNAGTELVQVDTMHQKLTTGYAQDDETNAQVVDLAYTGLDYSMVIVLPRERDGADALRRNFSLPLYHRLLLKLRDREVDVALPKFKSESLYKLKGPLSQLGASKVFDKQQADFSGISGSRDLFVSDVVHKAVVEVNEEGSEAAGATAVIFHVESLSVSTPFVVDHPFLFFIHNRRTGDILFAGQVNHL